MWAAFAAASRWSDDWANSNIVMVTDSSTVLAALCTGRSRCKQIMYYVRKLFWLSIEKNFVFSAVYVRSAENIICDSLSRLDSPDSAQRLLEADSGGVMCCREVFSESLCSYRRGASSRAEGVSVEGLRSKFGGNQGGATQEVPGICRRVCG